MLLNEWPPPDETYHEIETPNAAQCDDADDDGDEVLEPADDRVSQSLARDIRDALAAYAQDDEDGKNLFKQNIGLQNYVAKDDENEGEEEDDDEGKAPDENDHTNKEVDENEDNNPEIFDDEEEEETLMSGMAPNPAQSAKSKGKKKGPQDKYEGDERGNSTQI